MFMVRIKEKGGEDRMLPFEKEEVSIGRGKGNDIILPKGNVSKRHARIVHRDGKFIVVDLRSTNGTYFNARKISSPVIVTPQDKIYIGDFVLRVLPGGPEEADQYKSEPSIPIDSAQAPPMDAPQPEPVEAPPVAEAEPAVPFEAEEAEIPFEEPDFEEAPAGGPSPTDAEAEVPVEAADEAEPIPFETEPEADEAPAPVVETPTEDDEGYDETRAFDVSEIEEPAPAPAEEPAEDEAAVEDVPFAEPEKPAYEEPAYEEPAYEEPAYEEPAYEGEAEPTVEPVPVSLPIGGEGLLLELAAEDDVREITALGYDRVFTSRGGARHRVADAYADEASWRADIDAIVRRLGGDPASSAPFVEGTLAPDLQVRVLFPPLVAGGPVCQISKAPRRGVTLADLREAGVLDEATAELLGEAVQAGRNVMVVGPPRSGRTALVNALSWFVPESALVVVAEEKPGIQLPHAGLLRLQLGETLDEKIGSLQRLRRLGADAIAFGPLPARLLPTFLETAHEAAGTVVASATGRDLDRFVQHTLALCAPASGAAGLLAEALDVLVLLGRDDDGGFRVTRIAAIEEGADGELGLSDLFGG